MLICLYTYEPHPKQKLSAITCQTWSTQWNIRVLSGTATYNSFPVTAHSCYLAILHTYIHRSISVVAGWSRCKTQGWRPLWAGITHSRYWWHWTEAGEPRETSFWTMESPSTLQSEDLYILYVQVNPVYSMHRKIFYAYGESCSSACVDSLLCFDWLPVTLNN